MVKLSQQLQSGDRPTRTQRVAQRQESLKEKKEYEALKSEAEELQKTEFSDVKSVEEYEEKYSKLSADLKQFFQTPDEIREGESQQIIETQDQITERRSYADQQLQSEKERLTKAQQSYQKDVAWAQDKVSRGYKDNEWFDKYREQRKENLRDAEDYFEERQKYWEGYKRGLSEGSQQLSQGKNISYNSILDYANDIGSYEEERKRASNQNRKAEYQRQKKIEDLEAQGYKPMVIEKSYKGKTQEAYLTYYNPTAKDPYVKVATFKSPSQLDTTKLSKSTLGVVPIQRSLTYAGKKYTFKSNLQLYSDDQGKLLTKYGSVGYTEDELIKKQQDATYQAWKEQQGDVELKDIENVEKKTTVIDRGLNKIKSFITSWSFDITGTSIPKLTISRKQEGDAGQELATSLVKYGVEKVKTGYDKIPDLDIYIKQPSFKVGSLESGGLTFIKTSDKDIKLSEVKTKGIDYLTSIQETAYQKDLDKIGIESIESTAQEEYQKRFEAKYMKSLIYEEMTFEEAQAEFELSDEGKQLQKNYENTIKNELSGLGFTKQGFAQSGAGIGKSVLTLVPTTAKSTVITVGGVYAGYSALKLIPPVVAYTGTGLIGAYGGYKAFSPTSDPTERAGGLITLGIAGLTLGYGAYRYLRRPVVTTEKIKVPLKELKRQKVFGFEDPTKKVVKIAGKTYTVDSTYFPKQKLSRQIIAGRRTVVTTKGRSLLNKYLRLDIKPLYEGIPYSDPKGYAQAFKRLTKYGYTESQAKATLRYYQPRVIDTTLSKGVIRITTLDGKSLARGEFDILTEQPSIKIDERLGISTRYAKTKINYYDFERSTIKSIGDKNLIKTDILKTSPYAKLGKRTTRFEDYSIVESGELEKGVIKIGEGDGFDILKEAKYQDLKSMFAQRQTLPLKRKGYFGESETRIIKIGEPKVIEYDIDELMGISYNKNILQPAKITKTPFSKTFGATEEIKKILSKKPQKQPSISDVNKVIDKLESGSTSPASTSQYYGTGQYERSVGGLLPKETLSNQYLKDLPIQNLQKQVGIKDLIILKQNDLLALQVGTLSSLKIKNALKTDQLLKTGLKVDVGLKNLIKSKLDVGLKQEAGLKQSPALKTDLLLKSQLKSATTPASILKTPTIRIPEIKPPTIRPVTLPPFLLKGKIAEKIRKKRKTDFELAYLPDFTSRAIGLDPEILTQKQAQRRLKQILSGLEIRRAVKIKNAM